MPISNYSGYELNESQVRAIEKFVETITGGGSTPMSGYISTPFSTEVPLDLYVGRDMGVVTQDENLVFSIAGGAAHSGRAIVELILDGTSSVDIDTNFHNPENFMIPMEEGRHIILRFEYFNDVGYVFGILGILGDAEAPTLLDATVSDEPDGIRLTWSTAMNPAVSAPSAFTVTGKTSTDHEYEDSNHTILRVSPDYNSGDPSTTVSYIQPLLNKMKSLTGDHLVGNFSSFPVTNEVVDAVKPTATSIDVFNSNPDEAIFTWSEDMDTDVSNDSAFAISGHSTSNHERINATHTRLTFSPALTAGETVTADYEKPFLNPMKDLVGNEADSFSDQAVSNHVLAPGAVGLRFGINIPALNYFTPLNEMYRDLVRGANGFTLSGSPTTINATDGYPTTDFQFLPQAIPTAEATNGRIKGDCSSITYSGGTVTLGTYNAGTNTRTFTVNNNVAGAWEVITVNGSKRTAGGTPGEGVQEIIILRPGDTDFDSVATDPFTPEYIAHCQQFPGPLRGMDYQSTNNNVGDRDVGDRATTVNSRTNSAYIGSTTTPQAEGSRGVPDEDFVQLCNATGNDMWLCIPIGANDAYITDQATRLLDDLDPAIRVFVELGNELWNNSFAATTYVRNKVCDELNAFYGHYVDGASPYRAVSIIGDGSSVTVVFGRAHGLSVSDKVWTWPGEFTITAVPNSTTITYNQTGVSGEQFPGSSFSLVPAQDTDLRRGPDFWDDNEGSWNVYGLANRWILRRLTEICTIYRTVWGDSEVNTEDGRIRIIYADQIGYSPADGEQIMLDFEDLWPSREVNEHIYGLAGAPYFGFTGLSGTDTNPAITVADYVDALTATVDSGEMSNWWETRAFTCAMFNIKHLCYECGPDTFGDAGSANNVKKNQANFHADMQPAYEKYIAKWFSLSADVFCWYKGDFQAETESHPYGCWAISRAMGDVTNPKMVAALGQIADGLPVVTRNVAEVDTENDARFICDYYQFGPAGGDYKTCSNADTRYPHQGRQCWVVYSEAAQTIDLSFLYTCDTASNTAQLAVNRVNIGGLTAFSDSPADHTTVKETTPVSVTLRAGWNAVSWTRSFGEQTKFRALKWS